MARRPASVSVLIGDKVNNVQNGIFGAKIDYTPGALRRRRLRPADFKITNGRCESRRYKTGDNTVSILLGKGDGTFGTQRTLTLANGPAGITTADFNNDGHADLAVSNETDGTAFVVLGNGDGTFLRHGDNTAGSGPVGIVAANFTGPTPIWPSRMKREKWWTLGEQWRWHFPCADFFAHGQRPGRCRRRGSDLRLHHRPGHREQYFGHRHRHSQHPAVRGQFLSSASGQVGYPSAEYVDLGVKVKATPRLHGSMR